LAYITEINQCDKRYNKRKCCRVTSQKIPFQFFEAIRGKSWLLVKPSNTYKHGMAEHTNQILQDDDDDVDDVAKTIYY